MEYALITNNLTKQYKKQKAVNAVSLHVKRGEIYGFIGRNGAGKTTFMKMVSGLARPTDGSITLFGHNGAELKNYYSRIGTLIENPGIYPNMTAYQNMEAKCIAMGIYKKGYIEAILKSVHLDDTGKKKAKQFSLGMKQRLGIGLALIGEPDMLVLDEPINGLDPQGIVEVRETLLQLNKERKLTIMISSHILEELSKLADTYGIINDGQLIQEISREELSEKSKSYIKIETDNIQQACMILEKMSMANYKVLDKKTVCLYEHLDKTAEINQKLVMEGCMISSISIVAEELEDFYLQITGGQHNA